MSRTEPQPERGDFALAPFVFTDLSGAKVRPVLVLARVSYGDVIVAFVTSQSVPPGPDVVTLEDGSREFARSGLHVGSAIRLSRLATLHESVVQRRLGSATPTVMARVDSALRTLFQL